MKAITRYDIFIVTLFVTLFVAPSAALIWRLTSRTTPAPMLYYVTYTYSDTDSHGTGFHTIKTTANLDSQSSLTALREYIATNTMHEQVVILNWKPITE